MRRSLTLLATVAILIGLVAAPAAAGGSGPPSESGIVERFQDDGFGFIPIFDDGVWILANFDSLADVCEGPISATPDAVQLVHLPNGATVVKVNPGVIPIIAVPMVSDDPVADACSPGVEAIASGAVNILVNDNDFDGSGTRTNVWGDTGNGSATDSDGNVYRVHWHARVQLSENSGFRILNFEGSFG